MTLLEDIQKTLYCFICMETVRVPVMCLNCCQLGCTECFVKWINEKNQCPHCRTKVRPQELIRIPSLENIAEKVKSMEVNSCSSHLNFKEYYCLDCEMNEHKKKHRAYKTVPMKSIDVRGRGKPSTHIYIYIYAQGLSSRLIRNISMHDVIYISL